MASFVITITGQVTVFGSADTEKWGELVWGVDNWAIDNDMEFVIEKVLTSTANVSGAGLVFEPEKVLSGQVEISPSYVTLTHKDSNDFVFVYPSDVSNVVSAASTTFTRVSDVSDDFSTFSATSTSWTLL